MEIKIYVDILLLMNTIFNYLLLWITGLLLHRQVTTLRLIVIAFLGGLYAVCIFFLPSSYLYSIVGRLITGALMAVLAFRPGCLKHCLQHISVFYVTVFMIGGATICLLQYAGAGAWPGVICRNGSVYMNIPAYLLLLIGGLCYFLLKSVFAVGMKLTTINKQIIPVRIGINNRTALLRGYYDSGNLLCDRKAKGIIVAEWQSLKPLFPEADCPSAISLKLTTVSCRTLQGTIALNAFWPDEIYCEKGRRLIALEKRMIAITEEPLDFYHYWDAILPHDFEGVDKKHETNHFNKTTCLFKNT